METKVEQYLYDQFVSSRSIADRIINSQPLTSVISEVVRLIEQAFRDGRKLLLAGNGGSAADSQHIAGEFVSRFEFDRPGLPAVALTTDTSILTAIGNDYGYARLFARQIQALAVPGDVFIAYSTSGNSENIIEALIEAKSRGVTTIGMTGNRKGLMDKHVDYLIDVPSDHTPRIQEGHLIIGHAICGAVEQRLFSSV